MNGKLTLEKDDTALLIIDLQERLMNAMEKKELVYKNTNLLLALAKQFSIPVIVTEQYPRGLGPTVPAIKENLPQDFHYLEKTCFSVCRAEHFQEILEKVGRHTYIIVGSETHICVFQTARDLVGQSYTVYVPKDAVCSRFTLNDENGLELMREAGAVVTNTETIVFDLLKKAGTPAFKAISPLVK